jgi:chromosome segregation ATPase
MEVFSYIITGIISIYAGVLIYLIRHSMTNKKEIDEQIKNLEKQIVELQTCLKDTKQIIQDLREKIEKVDERLWKSTKK